MDVFEHGTGALLSSPEPLFGRLVFERPVDVVELLDEGQRLFTLFGKGFLELKKLSTRMRPAMGECEVTASLFERLVGTVPIAHYGAFKVLQQGIGRIGATTLIESITHRIGTAHRPHLPPLGVRQSLFAHQAPRRFIGSDHRMRQRMLVQRFVRGLQMRTQRKKLVPQRLTVDAQSLSLQSV